MNNGRAVALHITLTQVTTNTTVYEAWFQRSCLDGPVRVLEMKRFRQFRQVVSWLGCYRAGRVVGRCWRWCEGGGWLTGRVDSTTGSLTGDNIAFLYPDIKTALLGRFIRGVAESVLPAKLVSVETGGVLAEPEFRLERRGEAVSHSVSTRDSVGPLPLVRDPYEASVCQVHHYRVTLYTTVHLYRVTLYTTVQSDTGE